MKLGRETVVADIARMLGSAPMASALAAGGGPDAARYLASCRRLYPAGDARLKMIDEYAAYLAEIEAAFPREGAVDPVALGVGFEVLSSEAERYPGVVQEDVAGRLWAIFGRAGVHAEGGGGRSAFGALVGRLSGGDIRPGLAALRAFTERVKGIASPVAGEMAGLTGLWSQCGWEGLAMLAADIDARRAGQRELALDLLRLFDPTKEEEYGQIAMARLGRSCVEAARQALQTPGGETSIREEVTLWLEWAGRLARIIAAAEADRVRHLEAFRGPVADSLFEALGGLLSEQLTGANRQADVERLVQGCLVEDFFAPERMNRVIDRLLARLNGQKLAGQGHAAFTGSAAALAGCLKANDLRRQQVMLMREYAVLRQAGEPRDFYRVHAEILLRLLHGQAQTDGGRARLRQDIEGLLNQDTLECARPPGNMGQAQFIELVQRNARVCREVVTVG